MQNHQQQRDIYIFKPEQQSNIQFQHKQNDRFDPHQILQNTICKTIRKSENQIKSDQQNHFQSQGKDVITFQEDEFSQIYIPEDIDIKKQIKQGIQMTENSLKSKRILQNQTNFKDLPAFSHQNTILSFNCISQQPSIHQPSNILKQKNLNFSQGLMKNSKLGLKKMSKQQQTQIIGLVIYKCLQTTNIQIINKKAFLRNAIPPGIILNCVVKRNKDIMKFLSPQFDFYIQNGLKYVISAKKKMLGNTECFIISEQLGDYHKQYLLGSIKANSLHNQYFILGKEQGEHPESKFKFVYGEIKYGKLKKDKTQRQMKVEIPYKVSVGVKLDHINLFSFQNMQPHDKLILKKKKQNIKDIKFSQKQFMLVDDQQDDYSYLSLKKQQANVFKIQIQHPLTPFQAFGIVLTRFDTQLI